MKKKIFCILGIICGLVICILGFVITDEFYGYDPDIYNRYGADFYTDIYQATASAAVNVDRLGEMISAAFCYLLLAIGLTDICYFGHNLLKKETINVCSDAETTKSNAPVETTPEETQEDIE